MLVGVPKEVKNHEYRVGLTPTSVRELVHHGHQVIVETNAGGGIGAPDADYEAAGARIVESQDVVFAEAEMVVKVKEPQPFECKKLRPGQVLFTYLHLAPDPEQTKGLKESGAIAIAYETVTDANGRLPLLRPMSEVAGRMSVHVGANALHKAAGGRGVLMGGVPGVTPAKVVILGAGVSGSHAAEMALGLRADVTVLDRSLPKLAETDQFFRGQVKTRFSTQGAIAEEIAEADLVIGAVLVPGAAAPKLVTRDMLGTMKEGAVLVDIAIDQGGCAETSRPTTHDNPTYFEEDILHYCVANMPGAYSRTATQALSNVTTRWIMLLADKALQDACRAQPELLSGINCTMGKLTCRPVGEAHSLSAVNPAEVLELP